MYKVIRGESDEYFLARNDEVSCEAFWIYDAELRIPEGFTGTIGAAWWAARKEIRATEGLVPLRELLPHVSTRVGDRLVGLPGEWRQAGEFWIAEGDIGKIEFPDL